MPILCALAAAVLCVGAAAGPAGAQEDLPVQIRADAFRYDRRTRVLTATGNVFLSFEDIRIRADALVANLETGEVTAEGSVVLEAAGQTVTADLLSYNLNTRFGVLTSARTEYTGPLVLGPVRLRARRLEGIPDRFVTLKDGFVTTCDERDPVVHLTAREIAVFIGDKIVVRQATLWVAGRAVITLPSFVLFLRERRESQLTPVVGYTEAEGWFVKTSYNYFLNEDHYGFLYADAMERLGIGLGVEHLYRFRSGSGSALVYQLNNRRTAGTDLWAIFNHTQRLGPGLSMQLYGEYVRLASASGLSTSEIFATLDLFRSTARSSTLLFSTFSSISLGGQTALTGRLFHRQVLTASLFAEADLDFSRVQSSLGTDDEVFPRLTLGYAGPSFNAALVAETRWDVDRDTFTGDVPFMLERLPELTFALAPFRLGSGSFIAQVEGGLGRFRETLEGGETIRDAYRADGLITFTGSVPLGAGALSVRAFGRGSWYSTAQTRLFFGGRLEYARAWTPALETRLVYTGQSISGSSPFEFDRISGPAGLAEAEVFYRADRFAIQSGLSYDTVLGQFDKAAVQMAYFPRPGWTMALAATYDLKLGAIDRLEANVDVRIGLDWVFEYLGTYDRATGRIVHDRVTLTRIFCECLAVSLTYQAARDEIWLEAWLTAIPWGRGRIGIGRQGIVPFQLPSPSGGP